MKTRTWTSITAVAAALTLSLGLTVGIAMGMTAPLFSTALPVQR